jgi:hypothetical protein
MKLGLGYCEPDVAMRSGSPTWSRYMGGASGWELESSAEAWGWLGRVWECVGVKQVFTRYAHAGRSVVDRRR